MLIDTHTHLYSDAFDNDLIDVIKNARLEGINKFFLPAIDSSSHTKMMLLEKEYPKEIYAMMGLHPVDVKPDTYQHELEIVKKYITQRKFIAIGEIGIDLYWDKTTLEIQKEAFAIQIDWAKEKGWPIVIHCRDAFDEVFEVLESKQDEKLFGVFHCFTGSKEQAHQAINLGLKLGIVGVVTFKNGKIDQFLNQIDLSHIVLETDAPYLAPAPNRGKRNEPKMLKYVVEKLSAIYNVPKQTIAEVTTRNAKEIFNFT